MLLNHSNKLNLRTRVCFTYSMMVFQTTSTDLKAFHALHTRNDVVSERVSNNRSISAWISRLISPTPPSHGLSVLIFCCSSLFLESKVQPTAQLQHDHSHAFRFHQQSRSGHWFTEQDVLRQIRVILIFIQERRQELGWKSPRYLRRWVSNILSFVLP